MCMTGHNGIGLKDIPLFVLCLLIFPLGSPPAIITYIKTNGDIRRSSRVYLWPLLFTYLLLINMQALVEMTTSATKQDNYTNTIESTTETATETETEIVQKVDKSIQTYPHLDACQECEKLLTSQIQSSH